MLIHATFFPFQRTNSAILNDDSWLFSRFKTASNLISESAHEMGLWDLRDDSLHLKDDIKEVVHSIYNTVSVIFIDILIFINRYHFLI